MAKPKCDVQTAKALFLEYAAYELNLNEFRIENRYFTLGALPPSVDLTQVVCVLAATLNKMPGQTKDGWTVKMTHAFLASLEEAASTQPLCLTLAFDDRHVFFSPARSLRRIYLDKARPQGTQEFH